MQILVLMDKAAHFQCNLKAMDKEKQRTRQAMDEFTERFPEATLRLKPLSLCLKRMRTRLEFFQTKRQNRTAAKAQVAEGYAPPHS